MGLLSSIFGTKDKKEKRADFTNVSSGSSSTAPQVKKSEIERPPVTPPSAPAATAATEYEIQKGDTLSAIAQRFYGDATKWRRIHEANRDVIQDPDKIFPGQKITIPGDPNKPGGADFGNVSNV